MNERDALIILNAVDHLSNRQIHQLIGCFGSAQNVLKANLSDLSAADVSSQASNILKFPKDKFLQNEYNLINNNIKIITYIDESYPARLKEIADAPVVLYVYGNGLKDLEPSVAIVGSRQASVYGMTTAEKLAVRLAEYGVRVISGLARGIDTAAHRGCLKANGITLAVLGCGLAVSYPRENEMLKEEIAQRGAVISEFPMQTKPVPYNFPRRNRIVSGLSRGVIVVEAAEKSGALITADFALEQGRDVFAVPAAIDHPNSRGTHRLIKDGATLITSAEDVLEDLDLLTPSIPEYTAETGTKQPSGESLSEHEDSLYRFISDQPIHIDELVHKSNMDIPTATALLLRLEMKKMIKQLPGKRFKR